jgi:hypothetical protein
MNDETFFWLITEYTEFTPTIVGLKNQDYIIERIRRLKGERKIRSDLVFLVKVPFAAHDIFDEESRKRQRDSGYQVLAVGEFWHDGKSKFNSVFERLRLTAREVGAPYGFVLKKEGVQVHDFLRTVTFRAVDAERETPIFTTPPSINELLGIPRLKLINNAIKRPCATLRQIIENWENFAVKQTRIPPKDNLEAIKGYFKEAFEICYRADAPITLSVLVGALLEGTLTDALKYRSHSPIPKNLNRLIRECVDLRLIQEEYAGLLPTDKVRDIRNFIHPNRYTPIVDVAIFDRVIQVYEAVVNDLTR